MPGALVAAVFALALCALPASAQILVGQTSGFSGLTSTGVLENTKGAKPWFDHVNRIGGIHGKKIELVSLDDAGIPGVSGARIWTLWSSTSWSASRLTFHLWQRKLQSTTLRRSS